MRLYTFLNNLAVFIREHGQDCAVRFENNKGYVLMASKFAVRQPDGSFKTRFEFIRIDTFAVARFVLGY